MTVGTRRMVAEKLVFVTAAVDDESVGHGRYRHCLAISLYSVTSGKHKNKAGLEGENILTYTAATVTKVFC